MSIIFYDRNTILEVKQSLVDFTLEENVNTILSSILHSIDSFIQPSISIPIKKKNYRVNYNNNNYYNNTQQAKYIKPRPTLFPCNDEQKKKIIGLLNKLNHDNFDKITAQILEFLVKYDSLHFTIDNIIDVCSIQKNNCALYSKVCTLLLENSYDIKEYVNTSINNTLDSIIFNNDDINPDTNYEEFCKANKTKQKYINVIELYSILYIEERICDNSLFIQQIQKTVDYVIQSSTCKNTTKIYIESLLNISKNLINCEEYTTIVRVLGDETSKKDKYDFRTKFMISDIIDICWLHL
jgi:hypothetical protein